MIDMALSSVMWRWAFRDHISLREKSRRDSAVANDDLQIPSRWLG